MTTLIRYSEKERGANKEMTNKRKADVRDMRAQLVKLVLQVRQLTMRGGIPFRRGFRG